MASNWLSLLRALPGYPKIARERLTVAFYLGAGRLQAKTQNMSVDEAHRELCHLITSFVNDAPEGKAVRIFRCGAIHQPVVELIGTPNEMTSSHYVISAPQKRRTLIVNPEFDPDNSLSIAGLSEHLLQEFGHDVCAGRFSFENGRYRAFSNEELIFIDESSCA